MFWSFIVVTLQFMSGSEGSHKNFVKEELRKGINNVSVFMDCQIFYKSFRVYIIGFY